MNHRDNYRYTAADDDGCWQRQDEESRHKTEFTNNERYDAMKFQAKSSTDFEIAPEGNHVGICNAIVDLGIQPGSTTYPEAKAQVYIRFELPGEVVEYTKNGAKITGPMALGKTMTASMNKKSTLRKFVESWLGKKLSDEQAADFEFRSLLGKRCLLNVVHAVNGEKTYANIGMATPLPKGMKSEQAQHNEDLFFDLTQPDQKAFDRLPNWLKEKVSGRLDLAKATPVEELHDDVPF